jgi:serine/threonine protein phosphatase PrpC
MITQATAKGSRSYQEDRSFTFETPEYLALGVFDGHGGSQCAEHCAEEFPKILKYWLDNEDDVSLVLKETFSEINADTKHMRDGCAASVVLINAKRNQVHVAVLGDSPVLVELGGYPHAGSIWTAPEHNVRSNQAEADSAIARGGYVSQGYLFGSGSNGLQMSRAFGDASLDSVLNREPEVFALNLNKNAWVLVATDGAFDPAHHSDAGYKAVIDLVKSGKDAQAIVDRALAARTGDNVTAILWRT